VILAGRFPTWVGIRIGQRSGYNRMEKGSAEAVPTHRMFKYSQLAGEKIID